jgi:hypothetical protein
MGRGRHLPVAAAAVHRTKILINCRERPCCIVVHAQACHAPPGRTQVPSADTLVAARGHKPQRIAGHVQVAHIVPVATQGHAVAGTCSAIIEPDLPASTDTSPSFSGLPCRRRCARSVDLQPPAVHASVLHGASCSLQVEEP